MKEEGVVDWTKDKGDVHAERSLPRHQKAMRQFLAGMSPRLEVSQVPRALPAGLHRSLGKPDSWGKRIGSKRRLSE